MSPLDRSNLEVAGRSVSGGPIGACPACGGHEFLVLLAGEASDFLCTSCEHRWHYSMGFVTSADPAHHPDPSTGPSASAPSP
jgi:hypothetical protein